MAESTQQQLADKRNRVLEAALKELAKFERQENEFRRKDRAERAAELRLDLFNVH